MKLIVGITTVLLLAVFYVAYLYFTNLTGDSRSNDKTLAAIPSDASLILNFSNDPGFYEIFKDYELFNAITGETKKKELSWLKSLLLNNRELSNATNGQKVFLSFHPLVTDSLQFLWVMPFEEDMELTELKDVLAREKENQVSIASAARSLIQVKNKSIARDFYIGMSGGIVRGSFSKELVLSSLSKDELKTSKEFISEIKDAMLKEDDALASLFIKHSEPGFMKPFFAKKPTGNFGLFSSFDAYSNLHLNYKSDALMFNGITNITARHKGYLNLFLTQDPVQNTVKKIIPYNVSNAICYGLSNYNLFNENLKALFTRRNELPPLEEQIKLITTETGIDPDRDIRKLWGNEFTNIQLSTFENLAVIRISNGRQLQFYLDPLSSPYSDVIKKMNYDNLFYYYFGDPLKTYKKPFFTITDNLVIISNSPGTVQRFLNDYNSDRLLYNDAEFTKFDQLVADQSNISFILHVKNSQNLLKNLLKRDYANILNSDQYGFKNFYGFSYQLTSNSKHFFTNFYLGYENSETFSGDSLVYNENDIP